MTLAEVAQRLRTKWYTPDDLGDTGKIAVLYALSELEADHDFTLRERVEALVREWEADAPKISYPSIPPAYPQPALINPQAAAKRLRDLL